MTAPSPTTPPDTAAVQLPDLPTQQDIGQLLASTLLGNSFGTWLLALLIMGVTMLVLHTTQRAMARKMAQRGHVAPDSPLSFAITVLGKLNPVFLTVLGVYAGTFVLTIPDPVTKVIHDAVIIGLIVQMAIWMSQIATGWLHRYAESKKDSDSASATTMNVLTLLLKGAVWVVALLMILANMGVNITAFVASLGIGGIALALASQRILGDVFSSVAIVLDKPFAIGDSIEVDGVTATVEKIGLKTTRLRSVNGELVILANGKLLDARIRNFKNMEHRRGNVTVTVPYPTPHDQLTAIPELMQKAVDAHPGAVFKRAHLKDFAESGISYELVFTVPGADMEAFLDAQQAILLALYAAFALNNIAFVKGKPRMTKTTPETSP
jgi:small-conductance mechanosensitive channel